MKTVFKYLFYYIGLSIVGSILFALPGAFISLIIATVTKQEGSLIDMPWFIAFMIVGSQLAPLYFFWKQKWSDFRCFKLPNVTKMLLWIVVGWIGIGLINVFIQEYTPFAEWDIETLEEISGLVKNPLGFISCCILAPIVEEGIFRGAIERKLLERDWNPWWAIVISALIFAIAHFNMTQGLMALMMGLLFGWVYYRTRNIWLCVFGHALNNTTSSILDIIFDNNFVDVDMTASQEPASLLVNILVLVGGIALFILGIYLIDRQQKKNELVAPAPAPFQPEPVITVLGIPPIPPMGTDGAPENQNADLKDQYDKIWRNEE